MNTINSVKLSENKLIVNFDSTSLKLKFKEIGNKYLIDISSYNILEATKIAILTSTYCFLNTIDKKICWLVKDIETYQAIGVLRLRNIEQQIIEATQEKMVIAK